MSATHCAWFAEQWNIGQIRDLWPALQKPAQRYIACFETLAQLALAMTAPKVIGAKQWRFALLSASDNTAAEAGTEKLWSTAEPLGTFLKMAASWSARHHVELLVMHLPGEKNNWADELSRGRTACFQHRLHERVSITLHNFLGPAGCVTLHPPDASWHECMLSAQEPSRSEKNRPLAVSALLFRALSLFSVGRIAWISGRCLATHTRRGRGQTAQWDAQNADASVFLSGLHCTGLRISEHPFGKCALHALHSV